MSSAAPEGSLLRAARVDAGVSLSAMARLTAYSKAHLGNVETGRREVTVDLVIAYERELGPIGDELLRTKDITHPRVMKLARPTLTELARSIENGDPGALANTPTSRTVDYFLASKLGKWGTYHLREWIKNGAAATLRVNSVAVLSKMNHAQDTSLIIDALETDTKVQRLSLASEVSKLTQWDWDISLRVAADPTTAPDPHKLAKGLTKEATNRKDVECRWCGSHLLARLVPVLGK